MTTNSRLATLMLVATLIFMMACGGGGASSSGGIGGSGFTAVSVGSVSAIGSITVNGVRYETTGAAVTRDDGASFAEADLRRGLVVEVNGQVNADGVNGTATTVTVLTAVQGPVDQIDAATSSLTVMGQPVAIDDQTLFDDNIDPNNLNGIVDDIVEVSGTVDPDGTIRAMRIEAKPGETLRKVRGFVNTLSAPTFTINGLTIDFSSALPNDFGASGPPPNVFVAVRGTILDRGSNTLIAAVVDDQTRSFADEANVEIEGFITAAAGSLFTLVSGAGTFQFQPDAGTTFEGGVAADLAVGLKVEVEGAFSGGVLIADKVSIKDGIRLREVSVDTVNIVERTITLADLSALVLKLNDQTEISDDRDSPGPAGPNPTPDELLPTLSLNDDVLRVRARVSNTLIAGATELVVTELRVEDGPPSATVELRGPLDATPVASPLQILGIAVFFNGVTTTFRDLNEAVIGQAAFINQVNAGTLVEAEGALSSDNTLDATQLEIED